MTQPRKAPKGRIRGDHPMRGSDPMTAQKCTAHSKQTGHPCKQPAIAGGTVCRYHGGAAPQVQQKAMERLLALQHPAIDTLQFLMDSRQQFPSTAYAAARDVLDRTEGKAAEKLDLKVTGDADLIARLMGARRRTGS